VLISYFLGKSIPGWSSILLSIWFIGGVQVFAIGILGEYIGKIYTEVKHRPNYHIEKII
jgi:glycosyltransferase involved in cell wall biosynthesis